MRLSQKEQQVLAATEFDADVPLTKLQKSLKMPASTIRYHLNNLIDRGIVRYYPFINAMALGYTPQSLFFSLSYEGRKQQDKMLQFFRDCPRISWCAEIGAPYQYCITSLTRNLKEFSELLDEISNCFGSVFAKKDMVSQVSFTLFQTKYVYEGQKALDFLTWNSDAAPVKVDELDQRIMSAFLAEEYPSRRLVGRKLGIPVSTVNARINGLLEKCVIQRFLFLVNPLAAKMHTFKLLLFAKGFSTKQHQKFFNFCRNHPNITTLIRCVGSWDYEIGVEVVSPSEIVLVSNSLHSEFGENLAAIEELPQFNEHKVNCFPFMIK